MNEKDQRITMNVKQKAATCHFSGSVLTLVFFIYTPVKHFNKLSVYVDLDGCLLCAKQVKQT